MKQSKLYRVLETFDTIKLNRFLKFMDSPYFNSNEVYKVFAHALVKKIKSKDGDCDFNQLYTEATSSAYDDQKMRTLNSKLLGLVERFLIQDGFDSNKLSQHNYFLSSIRQSNIDVLYKKSVENAEKYYNRQIQASSDFHLQKYFLEYNKFNLTSEFEKKTSIKKELFSSNIGNLAYHLDLFYIIEKYRNACNLIPWKNLFKLDAEIPDLQFLESIIEQKKLDEYPVIKIYRLIYQTLIDSTKEKEYEELRDLVNENLEIFPIEEQKEIYKVLFSFPINKVNYEYKREYYDKILSLYTIGLETGLIFVDNQLSPTSFRNIVVSALRINKVEYAYDFIEGYKHHLAEKYRDNAVNFSYARIAMHTKEFEKAVEHISQMEFEDVLYKMNARLMLINAYYELKEDITLDSSIESYLAFLRREKSVPQSRKNPHINHVNGLRKLVKINPSDKQKLSNLKEELKGMKVHNKSWLFAKIDELL